MQVPQKEQNQNNPDYAKLHELKSTSTGFQFHHLPQLDGFRGLAVIFVLLGHLVEFSSPAPAWSSAGAMLAAVGVFLFFVLSGFLITSLLYKEKSEAGKVSLRNFYIRRVLRLAPALLLFLGVVTVLMVFRAITDIPNYELLACLFYARNFVGRSSTLAHLWSLSLEEQFYLCWPLVFSLLPLKRVLQFSVLVTASIVVWRGLAIYSGLFDYGSGIYYMRPYFRFDSILIGACLAVALARYPGFLSSARVVCRRIPATLAWLALLAWSYWAETASKPLYLSIQMTLIAFLLAQLVVAQSGWSVRFFSQPALCYIGRISYSLYLWQQLFLVTKRPSWGVVRQFPLDLVIPLAVAVLSYHFIEQPALRLKKRFQFVES